MYYVTGNVDKLSILHYAEPLCLIPIGLRQCEQNI